MSKVTQKDWGTTRVLTKHPNFSMHRIVVQRGGHCSWHLHTGKWNGFLVTEGVLNIETEGCTETLGLIQLGPAQFYSVPPGVKHRFRSPYGTVFAFETYWAGAPGNIIDPNGDDIVRFSNGGIVPC